MLNRAHGKSHFLLENFWISEPSIGVLEKFKYSLALWNIKCNCTVLFLSQLHRLLIYASKYMYILPYSTIVKPSQNWLILLKNSSNYRSSCRVNNATIVDSGCGLGNLYFDASDPWPISTILTSLYTIVNYWFHSCYNSYIALFSSCLLKDLG